MVSSNNQPLEQVAMRSYNDDYGLGFHAAHSEARRLRRAEALATLAAPLPERTSGHRKPIDGAMAGVRLVAVALVIVTAWVAAWVVAFAW